MKASDDDNRWTLLASAATALGTAVVAGLAARKDTTLAERVAVLEAEVARLKEEVGPQ